MTTRVLIAERERLLRNLIREMIGANSDFDVVGLARDGPEAIQMAMELAPDVALLAYDLPALTGPQTSEILSALSPDTMSILITEARTTESLDKALRSGARAVVAKPLSTEHICALISELAEIRQHQRSVETLNWADATKYPRIIAITGAKGGVGKSTVAVNLSTILAQQAPGQVVLIDFYTQFGDIPTMFNFTPKGTIAEIMPVCAELDTELVKTYITQHPSGVHILVMSVEPLPPDVVDIECLDNLFNVLKRMYRFIVVDMPPMLHETTLHVLTHSNMILLVTNLFDLTTLTDTKKFYDTLRAERVSNDRIGIILNRVSKTNHLHLKDVEHVFACPIVTQIPEYGRVMTAINEGRPAVLMEKGSAFTRSIEQIAKAVSSQTTTREEPSPVLTGNEVLVAGQ